MDLQETADAEQAMRETVVAALTRRAAELHARGWRAVAVELDTYDCDGRCTEVQVPMDGPAGFSQTVLAYLVVECGEVIVDAEAISRQLDIDIDALLV